MTDGKSAFSYKELEGPLSVLDHLYVRPGTKALVGDILTHRRPPPFDEEAFASFSLTVAKPTKARTAKPTPPAIHKALDLLSFIAVPTLSRQK